MDIQLWSKGIQNTFSIGYSAQKVVIFTSYIHVFMQTYTSVAITSNIALFHFTSAEKLGKNGQKGWFMT